MVTFHGTVESFCGYILSLMMVSLFITFLIGITITNAATPNIVFILADDMGYGMLNTTSFGYNYLNINEYDNR